MLLTSSDWLQTSEDDDGLSSERNDVRLHFVIRSAGTFHSDCSLSNVMSDNAAHGSVGRMNTYVAGSMPRRSLAASHTAALRPALDQ